MRYYRGKNMKDFWWKGDFFSGIDTEESCTNFSSNPSSLSLLINGQNEWGRHIVPRRPFPCSIKAKLKQLSCPTCHLTAPKVVWSILLIWFDHLLITVSIVLFFLSPGRRSYSIRRHTVPICSSRKQMIITRYWSKPDPCCYLCFESN